MPEQQDGFEIYGRFYPIPESYSLADPVLVRQVTAMEWPEFIEANAEMEEAYRSAREAGEEAPEADAIVLAGIVAVSFWHGNRQMSREKVRRVIERLKMEDVEFISAGEDDADPPAPTEVAFGETPSMTSNGSDASLAAELETSSDSSSDDMTPNGSGGLSSLSSHPESLPA